MFHVQLRKRCNSLFCGKMSYRYQLGLTGPLYHLKFVVPCWFCLVELATGANGVLKSPSITVLLLTSPFILVNNCLTYCSALMLGACIFIIVISLCSVLCLFSQPLFKVHFIRYEYCYYCFFLVSICMKYIFPALLFQCVCVPWLEVGLL